MPLKFILNVSMLWGKTNERLGLFYSNDSLGNLLSTGCNSFGKKRCKFWCYFYVVPYFIGNKDKMTKEEKALVEAYKKGMADACSVLLETIRAKQIENVADLLPSLAYTEKQSGNHTIH